MKPIVKSILGIEEQDLVKLPSETRNERFLREAAMPGDSDDAAKQLMFFNERTQKLYPCGSFDTPLVEKLRAQVEAMGKGQERRKDAPPLTTESGIDIGEFQGKLTTADCAMVQVASNFNCLENPSRRTDPAYGWLVDGAHEDATQGPAAVFGTLPAYLYRAHFLNGGQSADGYSLSLLHEARNHFGVPEVGKLTLTGSEDVLETEADINAAADKVAIGLHANCPIICGRARRSLVPIQPTVVEGSAVQIFPVVDQVLSASINFRDFGVALRNKEGSVQPAMFNLTRSVLRAAYEGIYLAAILRQRKALYLTLVGGGVFGNPIPMIVEEIERAHARWANHPSSKLEKVMICLYSRQDSDNVRMAMASKKK